MKKQLKSGYKLKRINNSFMKESMRDKNDYKESIRKTILIVAWQKMVASGEIFVV